MSSARKCKENLAKLAAYLAKLPDDYEKFNMWVYFSGRAEGTYMTHGGTMCGTAACAVGHGPAAGIKSPVYDSWNDYCLQAFCIETQTPEFEWLFGGSWNQVDNTPKGAAARIRYYLENGGIPVDHANKARTTECYAHYLKEDA